MRLKILKTVRRFRKDITGTLLQKGKFNKLSRFLLNIRAMRKARRRRPVGLEFGPVKRFTGVKRLSKGAKLLRSRRKLCLFYGDLPLRLFKNLNIKASRTRGKFKNNLVGLLESRLEVVVYRMLFVRTILQARTEIKAGFYMVNKQVIRDPNYFICAGDIVEVLPQYKCHVYRSIGERMVSSWLMCNTPRYVEVDYRLLGGCFLYVPVLEEVGLPFLNTYRTEVKNVIKSRRRYVWLRRAGFTRRRRWWFKFRREKAISGAFYIGRKF